MEKQDIQTGKGARVEWVDSSSIRGWHTGHANVDLLRIVSLGIVGGCKKDALVLTSSIDEQGHLLDPIAIPWVSITKIELLKPEFYEKAI